MLHVRHEYNYHTPQSQEMAKNLLIWLNSLVRVQGKPLQDKAWNCDLKKVDQIWRNGRSMMHDDLCKELRPVPFTWYRYRWRIQDFPEVGAPTFQGRPHKILPNFPKNCMKLKEFGPGVGRTSLVPRLDPPMTWFDTCPQLQSSD